jgi:hypothetical protein
MLVNKRSLQDIFDPNSRLEAPLFQRSYVWVEKNWRPLWDAVVKGADRRAGAVGRRPYFLGTIVLDQNRCPTGSIPTRQIIDGQQRLTTLQLLLAAARDPCREWHADDYREAFELLTTNRTPLTKNPNDKFKVWPTHVDQHAFRETMSAGSGAAIAPVRVAHADSRIPPAYQFFADRLAEWLVGPADGMFDARLRAVYDTLREDVNLVVIDLDQQDDAQVIFETLNALGTPLLPADLVKNFLFHQARVEGVNIEALYEGGWRQFDDQQGFWRQAALRGRLKSPRIDLFLQHYLTLMASEEVSYNELFNRFRKLVWDEPGARAADHIGRFKDYAQIYRGFSTFAEPSRERVFFERLDAMEMSTLFPLLMEVFRRMPGVCPDRSQILDDLESFLVRRMVCGMTTKSYTQFFANAIKKLRDAGDFSARAVRRLLLEQTSEASRWPDDAEFRAGWTGLRVYKKLLRTRTRMLLGALDGAMQTGATEGYRITGALSIEHLLPQKWDAKHWPLASTRPAGDGSDQPLEPEAAEEWRNELLHTIGNLTLVTQKLNSKLRNGPWDPKKAAILRHSALNLNRRFQDVAEWHERAITQRSAELFELARAIWPRPAQVPAA